jgi:hypothetical protein
MVNANNIGAAWAAAYLNTMVGCRVSKALFLVTTDLRQQQTDGQWKDVFGWDALYLDPVVYGNKAYPKPIYHVFDMISRLEGHRVESTRGSDSVNCFATADPDKRKITMLVWNYAANIPEGGVPLDKSAPAKIPVHVRDAGDFFHAKQVKIETWQINENTDNVAKMLTTGVAPDEQNTAMAQLPPATAKLEGKLLDFALVLPPSSVSLVVVTEMP